MAFVEGIISSPRAGRPSAIRAPHGLQARILPASLAFGPLSHDVIVSRPDVMPRGGAIGIRRGREGTCIGVHSDKDGRFIRRPLSGFIFSHLSGATIVHGLAVLRVKAALR